MDFMTYLTLVSILALLDRKKIYNYKLIISLFNLLLPKPLNVHNCTYIPFPSSS